MTISVEDDDNGYLEDMVALVDPLDLDPARFLQQSLSTQPVTCYKCGKILADRRNLERHLATAHQGEDARVECPFCRKTFKNKGAESAWETEAFKCRGVSLGAQIPHT